MRAKEKNDITPRMGRTYEYSRVAVPPCHGTDIVRHGKTPQGKQRYRCRETACRGGTFLLDSSSSGQSPHIKAQIVNMAINASGIRDTARELHVNPTTVIPTVSPLMIPLVPCHINSFQRASSVEKPWPGGENRLDGRASHPEAL
jgi:InsA N-terminal domain/InsA C-terminal domain